MSLEILFKDIKPFVRFSATQHLAVSAPYLKDADVVPYDHRIYFCTKGEGTVFIENEKYVLTPNTILIWRSGLRYRCSKATDSFTCITVNFDFLSQNEEKVTPLAPQGVKYFKPNQIFENNIKFVDNEYFNDVIYLTNITKAENIMSDIVKTFREGFTYNKLFLSGLLIHLFKIVMDHKISNKEYENGRNNIHSVVTYIHQNYNKDLTNSSIAEMFNYHPNYLSKLFLEQTGYSLHNYIIKYRLSRAVKLLMSTDLSISKICETVNIEDQHYFSRLFKKYYKTTPSKFRQKL